MRYLIVTIVLLAFTLGGTGIWALDLNFQREQNTEKIDELENLKSTLIDQNHDLKVENSVLSTELRGKESILQDLQGRLKDFQGVEQTLKQVQKALHEEENRNQVLQEENERYLDSLVDLSRFSGRVDSVKVIPLYFYPSDTPFESRSIWDIEVALAKVQSWYASQLNGVTFARGNMLFLKGWKTLSEYRQAENLTGAMLEEILSRTPSDPDTVILGFMEGAGEFAGGIHKWAFLGDVALEGISRTHERNSNLLPPWMRMDSQTGAIAHELGHAFGLPHSTMGSVMATGWWNFPAIGLTTEERELLFDLLN